MKKPKLIFPLMLLLFLIPSISLAGTLYKWVDEDGVVHVTDDPQKVPKEHIPSVKKSTPNDKVDILRTNLEWAWAGIKAEKGRIAAGIAGLIALLVLYKSLLYAKPKLFQGMRRRRLTALENSGIDNLDPAEFRRYIEELLTHRGFSLKTPEGTLDLGVDFIAVKAQIKSAVQIKQQAAPVSKAAVNYLDREKHRYGCDHAMIISNNYFTDDAVEAARSNACELIDRERLGEWIRAFERR